MCRAKIVCTLGPAVNTTDRLVQFINAGMNVAYLNTSYGGCDEHEDRLNAVRETARIAGRTVDVLADPQGPKIRFGRFVNDQKHYLGRGDRLTTTIEDILGTKERCSTTFKGLPGDVKPGDQALIDDGKMGLRASEVSPTEVLCEVIVAGPISSNKGINLPGAAVPAPAMSEKDEWDLRWVLSKDVDMIALSFVHSGDDIEQVHEIVEERGRRIPVIAKLKKLQAIANLQEIVDAFGAFMVTRGDLGVELPLEDVPLVQKQIIRAARKWVKPVIAATQMLESMVSLPWLTRAEASDVANAVLDGADSVMLFGETPAGDYPVEAIRTIARIVEATERDGHTEAHVIDWDPHTTGGVLAHVAAEVTRRVGVRCLVALIKSGDTARWLFRLCPFIPLLVSTPEVTTRQVMTLAWGAEVYITPDFTAQGQMVETVDAFLRERGIIEVGERIVILSGSPIGAPGKTNNLRVHKVKAKGETDV